MKFTESGLGQMVSPERMTVTAYIALGSNLGDREATLYQAAVLLHEHPMIDVIRCSCIYETEPVGFVDQPAFLNMVIRVSTYLPAFELFAYMTLIEQKLNRVRDIRWGPRTIDLDLLLYHDSVIQTEKLTVPHPRMHERPFVMIPLLDAVEGDGMKDMLNITAAANKPGGREGVILWKTCSWHTEFAHSGN